MRKNLQATELEGGTSWLNTGVCGFGRVCAADWKSPAYHVKSQARTKLFRRFGIQKKGEAQKRSLGVPIF